jgi:hypothetical protein
VRIRKVASRRTAAVVVPGLIIPRHPASVRSVWDNRLLKVNDGWALGGAVRSSLAF